MITALRILLAPVILACITISVGFAFEFGWGKAVTEYDHWAFALAGGGLDLFKAALPIFAAYAMTVGERTKARAAWIMFCWLTVMSLWCAYGTTATQLAERVTNKAVALAGQQAAQTRLQNARTARAALPAFEPTTQAQVRTAQAAADTARQQREAECKNGRGTNCRNRETDERAALDKLAHAQANQDLTDQARTLDDAVAAADKALGALDLRAATKDADPQSASLHDATGWDERKIALFGHLLFAIGIEAGSGLGLWFILGHGAHRRLDELDVEPIAAPAEAPDLPVALGEPVFGSRQHFFRECIVPHATERTSAAVVYRAYQGWCSDLGIEPMAPQVFGKGGPWPKQKIGGTVYYLQCQMALGRDAIQGNHLRLVGSS